MGWEKEGGVPRPQSCMDHFKEALEFCSLTDLGFEGDVFTWRNNNHRCEGYIRERLDQAIANVEWRSSFPGLWVINGDHRHSNHRPVVVVTDEEITHQVRSGQPSFRFEAGWIKEVLCEPIVENAWKLYMNVHGGKVENAVQDVVVDLWDWNCNVLGDLGKRIKKAKRALKSCRSDQLNARNVTREHVLKYILEKLEDQKDLHWRQCAHVLWLKNGDHNSKFFHQFASERRTRNKITRLVTEEGGVATDEGEMRVLVANYYNHLFESHAGDRIDELLQHVPVKVPEEVNRALCKELTSEEIKEALDGIGDLKAPGSEGMPALFYKQFWHIIGDDIVHEVKSLFRRW